MVKTQNVDTKLLNEAIERSGLQSKFICSKLGVSRQSYNNKRSGRTAFRGSEVYVMCDLLRLNDEEKTKIFFPEMLG